MIKKVGLTVLFFALAFVSISVPVEILSNLRGWGLRDSLEIPTLFFCLVGGLLGLVGSIVGGVSTWCED